VCEWVVRRCTRVNETTSTAGEAGSREARKSQEVADWNASAEGKQFVTRVSEHWDEASIAAGTDRAEAQAAAQRTTAFYTGEGPAA
jgi:hypothetical protein